MTIRIRTTEPTLKVIRDTGATLPLIDPAAIAAALGGEMVGPLESALSPITLSVVRDELAKRLQSSGGRPALTDTGRRSKIPLADADWLALEEIAATLAAPGLAPTAGQVASVLLRLSLQSVASRLSRPEPALARELAARSVEEPATP